MMPTSNLLLTKLRAHAKNGDTVGFCKWKDGKGVLFGKVVGVRGDRITFDLVHPDGSFDETTTYRVGQITRLQESRDYVKRLASFARIVDLVPKSKAEVVRTRRAIRKCLVVAAKSGECVRLGLLDDPVSDYRVVRVSADLVQLEELGDDPNVVRERLIVGLAQIAKLQWRSTGERLATKLRQRRRKQKSSTSP